MLKHGWMITINVSKCAFIHFSLKRKFILSYTYTMLDEVIPRVTDIKDLGVIFMSNFSFSKHINDITSKSFRLLGFLERVLKPFKDRSVLLSLYLSLIRQKLEYCSFIWAPKVKSMSDKIERVQKTFFKFMCFQMDIRGIELSYPELCFSFDVQSLSDRRNITDLSFLNKVINDKMNCFSITSTISLYAPERPLRRQRRDLFKNASRINIRKNSPMIRAQRLANETCELDIFQNVSDFRRSVKRHYSCSL